MEKVQLTHNQQIVWNALLEINQIETITKGCERLSDFEQRLKGLLDMLWDVEVFYRPIGGIVGYHHSILDLLKAQGAKDTSALLQPEGLDISLDSPKVAEAVERGIEAMPVIAEIYPIGGAGDRLNFCDPKTEEHLPVALFPFCGHTLLEYLIRDVVAREHLYFCRFGKKVVTPIALMTSSEKGNHEKITAYLDSKRWFGRPKDHFFLFKQPLVPVVTLNGDWVMLDTLELMMKPGGHGVIWKLASECGVFEWLKGHQRTHVLVRQINNPIAGLDQTLLALAGLGIMQEKSFGFASCPRLVNASEGVNVCRVREEGCCITNVEYTDFVQRGIVDAPVSAKSPYSLYPTNTNIIFAKIEALEEGVKRLPFPGQIINMKTNIETEGGKVQCGRLETTMQNLADAFEEPMEGQKPDQSRLRTYIVFNERVKTISVVKKPFIQGQAIHETAKGAEYDLYSNGRNLLYNYCKMDVPEVGNEEGFVNNGPSFTFRYHPALGPLYSIIGEKVRGGKIEAGGVVNLEIADIEISDIHVAGSFSILANDLYRGRAKIQGLYVPKGVHIEITIEGNSEFVSKNWRPKEDAIFTIASDS